MTQTARTPVDTVHASEPHDDFVRAGAQPAGSDTGASRPRNFCYAQDARGVQWCCQAIFFTIQLNSPQRSHHTCDCDRRCWKHLTTL
jgi:hypothetical protein